MVHEVQLRYVVAFPVKCQRSVAVVRYLHCERIALAALRHAVNARHFFIHRVGDLVAVVLLRVLKRRIVYRRSRVLDCLFISVASLNREAEYVCIFQVAVVDALHTVQCQSAYSTIGVRYSRNNSARTITC